MRFTAVLVFRINHMAPHTFLHPIYSGIALLCGVACFGSVWLISTWFYELLWIWFPCEMCVSLSLSLSVRVRVLVLCDMIPCFCLWFFIWIQISHRLKKSGIHSNFPIKLSVRRARARIPLNFIRWRITILQIHFVQFTFNHGLFSSFFVDGLLNSFANGTYTASYTACLQLFCCCYNNVGFYYTTSLRKIPLVTYLYSTHIVSQCKLCVCLCSSFNSFVWIRTISIEYWEVNTHHTNPAL